MGPPSRPASAMSSSRSRPGTSEGPPAPAASSFSKSVSGRSKRPQLNFGVATGRGGSSVASTPRRTSSGLSASSTSKLNLGSKNAAGKKTERPSLGSSVTKNAPRGGLSGSKTVAARPSKSRASLAGAFDRPDSMVEGSSPSTPTPTRRAPPAAAEEEPATSRKVSNSSVALREQIAKAKAAKKANVKPGIKQSSTRESMAGAAGADDFNFDLDSDPFNVQPKAGSAVIKRRVDSARSDGRLNIAAMGLNEIPPEVLKMYEYDPTRADYMLGAVDLVRFVAADNEIEAIQESVFPDASVGDPSLGDDDAGPQFGGIEFLDLHGNLLKALPTGLRRLERLTTLNLSRNRLSSDVFNIISQVESLRDLKLATNALEGGLPDSIGKLTQLETLELQENKITSLPASLCDLTQLKILNASSNRLSSLPADVFTTLSLQELLVSKNSISGTLIPFSVTELPRLQVLQVASNELSALSGSIVEMPALRSVDISANRIEALQDVSSWTSLVTLLAEDNKLSSLPDGFTSLPTVRQVDLTGNDFSKVDERIAFMDSLSTFKIAANPLRDRKFLTMATEDMKDDLRARLAPPSHALSSTDPVDVEEQVPDALATPDDWTLSPSGTLDLSSKDLSSLDDAAFASFAGSHDIRQLALHHNSFTSTPPAISLAQSLTVLDLSHNQLSAAFTSAVTLPHLRDLRLAANRLPSLASVLEHLTAPHLQHLDAATNRLSGALPPLKPRFPALRFVSAADNRVAAVDAAALDGLKSVDLRNNDIAHLPPEIGLLADTLTSLELEGNRFRVPSYAVLTKGTEAVLSWLRDKIPAERTGEEGAVMEDEWGPL
ncbi:hypothetical protein BDY21DRAFT_303257 [Lineolata rhizophorae]|uniref:Disease resistance R13L4/SHOC-2-like LRR domain-containing protein n=1 Tax=Lineolata rhizophorae TaxID=578093 RepID=A0A6A6P2P6_9PEZI|nr:hypothetical protein BDY21DRAFT_303257 [Lineolata rhizophorae]